MFQCPKCESWELHYDSFHKTFQCQLCGHIEEVKPHKRRCFRCGKEFEEYTWFDPSGCPSCHKSFVD